jgi:hypothetical protein
MGVLLPDSSAGETSGIDITCSRDGRGWAFKVKGDPYFGVEPAKIADRQLAFYRREGADYAFEAIANNVTRHPGWIFQSHADQLYYYFLALGQPESEIGALLEEPDDVFFPEIKVERDELHVIPMERLRAWFEANYEHYTPRPVLMGDHSAWYRLVPREVLRAAVPVTVVGPLFDTVLGD